MANHDTESGKQEGIPVDALTFDVDGNVEGLHDDILNSVTGGLRLGDEGCPPLPNSGC